MAKKKYKILDQKTRDFLDLAKKRLKWEVKADDHNRKAAIECLNFLIPGNQWDEGVRKERANDGRPCLEIPLLGKYVAQVVGEMLHNRARISITPVDNKADPHIAKIRQGIIANTEYISNAEDIYLEAGKMQTSCGYGAWRVNTRYCEDNPFLQEIYAELIPNPFMVYLDSRRKDPAGSDAKYGFILTRMPKDEFEDEYPDAVVPGSSLQTGQGMRDELWYDAETVTVAEYFTMSPAKVTMCQMADGTVMSEDAALEVIKAWEKEHQEKIADLPEALTAATQLTKPAVSNLPQQTLIAGSTGQAAPTATSASLIMPTPKPKIIKKRVTEQNIIKHYTITSDEILSPKKDDKDFDPLEGETVPGKYIPIVLVTGPTLNVQGKVYIKGLITDGRDSQKLVNYWESSLAEAIALAPKAPWVGTARQFEGYEDDYKQANIKNFPFLKYTADTEGGSLLPPPMRQSPANPPTALFSQASRSHDNLKEVLGMGGTDSIQDGPERTGAAVWAKQKPGDISTYVYAYNLNRGIEHGGKIISEMIPQIYDSERDARIRNIDDTEYIVPINSTAGAVYDAIRENPERYSGIDAQRLNGIIQRYGKNAKFNDMTVGKYDVIIKAGPSYATARQESAMMMQSLTQALPQQMAPMLPIMFENMDFKDADRMAAVAKKMLPPGLYQPKEGEPPPLPQPPNPQAIIAQSKVKIEELKVKGAEIKLQLENIKLQQEIQSLKPSEDGTQQKAVIEQEMNKLKLISEAMSIEHEQQMNQIKMQSAQLSLMQQGINAGGNA